MPIFSSTNLYDNKDYFSNLNLSNKFVLINFFASWCTPCKLEHHLFFEIKKEFPNLYRLGINHKDKEIDAKKYLSEEGNPYSFVTIDPKGKVAIEFGVFGLPETFLINDKGKIRAYTATSKPGKIKDGIRQSTFKKPSLKQLKDWMGY